MYLPKSFEETRAGVLADLVRAYPFATLVIAGADGFAANHLPLELGADGRLRGHVARGNELARADGAEVLAIFHGPDAYVSPNWYPSKHVDGRAVPTWNYAVVQAHGRLHTTVDPAWLRELLRSLTARNEASSAQPWTVEDAPADYIERQLAGIVGLEIEVARMTGKFKLSQNHPAANRAGVVAGLRQRGGERDAALAAYMEFPHGDPPHG